MTSPGEPQLRGRSASSCVRWKCWCLPSEASGKEEIGTVREEAVKTAWACKKKKKALTSLSCLSLAHLLPSKDPQCLPNKPNFASMTQTFNLCLLALEFQIKLNKRKSSRTFSEISHASTPLWSGFRSQEYNEAVALKFTYEFNLPSLRTFFLISRLVTWCSWSFFSLHSWDIATVWFFSHLFPALFVCISLSFYLLMAAISNVLTSILLFGSLLLPHGSTHPQDFSDHFLSKGPSFVASTPSLLQACWLLPRDKSLTAIKFIISPLNWFFFLLSLSLTCRMWLITQFW